MTTIRVEKAGLLTTVQDLGRFGWAHLGVSACGAADSLSLRAGNRLVRNPEGAAALEMTLAGGWFVFEGAAVFALTGMEFAATLDGSEVPFWRAVRAEAGVQLEIGTAREGARCYLCAAGGLEVPVVMGSRATDLRAGFGGFEGRALRRGDRLVIGNGDGRAGAVAAASLCRFLRGPELRVIVNGDGALCSGEYTVRPESNRMGLRLAGPRLVGGEVLTEGVSVGAVQVPASGEPILLLVDQQTTGGYAQAAHVISADLPRAGQLRPGERVRFRAVERAEALEALREQELELARLEARG